MSNPRLLVVDDEPQILRALNPGLSAGGYDVVTASNASGALQAIASQAFDVIILDLGLPDLDGKQVIEQAREWVTTPILVLSARDSEQEKIAALDMGANDFVNKPFSIGELMARLRALRRVQAASRAESASEVTVAHLVIDFAHRKMTVFGKVVRPSPRELKLLRAFTQHLGQVLTHKQIVTAVWGPEAVIDPQFVRVLIGNLRQKIEKVPARPTLIVTESGIGYRMVDLASDTPPAAR